MNHEAIDDWASNYQVKFITSSTTKQVAAK